MATTLSISALGEHGRVRPPGPANDLAAITDGDMVGGAAARPHRPKRGLAADLGTATRQVGAVVNHDIAGRAGRRPRSGQGLYRAEAGDAGDHRAAPSCRRSLPTG